MDETPILRLTRVVADGEMSVIDVSEVGAIAAVELSCVGVLVRLL